MGIGFSKHYPNFYPDKNVSPLNFEISGNSAPNHIREFFPDFFWWDEALKLSTNSRPNSIPEGTDSTISFIESHNNRKRCQSSLKMFIQLEAAHASRTLTIWTKKALILTKFQSKNPLRLMKLEKAKSKITKWDIIFVIRKLRNKK